MPGKVALLRLALAAAILVAWQLASGRLIDTIFLSSPVLVAQRLVELFVTGEIFMHLRATVTAVVQGYVVGAVVGIGLGFATGRSAILSQTLEPFLMAFGLEYFLVEHDGDGPRISEAFRVARETRRPVVVLVGDEYHGFNR